MVKYTIKMLQGASDDLKNIYSHKQMISKEMGTVEKMVDALDNGI